MRERLHFPPSAAEVPTEPDIRHLGNHLAWYIFDTWTRDGYPVDIMTHSMGGLLARYALYWVARQDPQSNENWPPYLLVEDVVSVGVPHKGIAMKTSRDGTDGGAMARAFHVDYNGYDNTYQARQMCPQDGFIQELDKAAQHPRGQPLQRLPSGETLYRTQWSLLGSWDDIQVPWQSATGMDAERNYVYWYRGNQQSCSAITHDDYLKEKGDKPGLQNSCVRFSPTFDRNSRAWSFYNNQVWPVQRALTEAIG